MLSYNAKLTVLTYFGDAPFILGFESIEWEEDFNE